ncbi:phosphate transporter permease [filamentous cyanobacterium CCP5]|nr:phosphate transporter permease [filamentous cyanobacterium CCP5]
MPKDAGQKQPTEMIIRPITGSFWQSFRELYLYRSLFWSLTRRDIKLQFQSMYLGVAWVTVRPLLMVTLFALFKRFSGANLHVPIPYMLYVYSGLILWFYFVEATSLTSRSIQKNASLITKIYYPRIINFLVPPLACLYGLGIAIIPLVVMMIWQNIIPGWQIILLPVVMLGVGLLALATGTMFAVLSLNSMDFDKLLGQILYIGFYVSPVLFAPGLIPESARVAYYANPMAGLLIAFRAVFFEAYPFPTLAFVYAMIATLMLVFGGLVIYQRTEIYLVDKL